MCGLFLYTKNQKITSPEAILELLKHRGPDGKKFIDNEEIVLGHRLLAVRDKPEKSIQPVASFNKRYLLSFNGNIWNLKTLKDKYNLDKNLVLDTTVLIQIIEKVGTEFINEIRGIFAILLYDTQKRIVYAFRDNTGQIPLYYYYKENKFFACSEIDTIYKSLNISPEIDEKEVQNSFRFINKIGHKTIYQNIFKLIPGEMIELNVKTNTFNKKFFKPKIEKNCSSLFDYVGKSVEENLQNYGKVILNLSGGIDSNIILYEILKKGSKIDICSTSFDDNQEEYSEDFKIAEEIAKENGLFFLENKIDKKEYLDNFFKTYETLEEISGNLSSTVWYLTYKFIKNHNYKTVYAGDGGDEIFIGYDWFFLFKSTKIFKKYGKFAKIIMDNSFLARTIFFYFNFYKKYNTVLNCSNYFERTPFLDNVNYYLKASDLYKKFKNYNFKELPNNLEISNLIASQFFWLSNETFNKNNKLAMSSSLDVRFPLSEFNLRYNFMKGLKKADFETLVNKFKTRNYYSKKLNPKVFGKKRGWPAPQNWIESKQLLEKILDIMPNKVLFSIKWDKIKNDLIKNPSIIRNRSFFPLISFLILLNKYNLQK
jgi:asparagine synthase (glutamine-hydrolysing)